MNETTGGDIQTNSTRARQMVECTRYELFLDDVFF
jgi:hypothetical protein